MRFYLYIDLAAFEDAPAIEVAKSLRDVADLLDGGRRMRFSSPHPHFAPGHEQPMHGSNGNEVGYFGVNGPAGPSRNCGKVQ